MIHKKLSFALVAAILLLPCCTGCTIDRDWVQQDRDNYGELDDAGLDRWIRNDLKLSEDKREALLLLNIGRRARVKRGCELAGIPPLAYVEPKNVTSVASPVNRPGMVPDNGGF